MVYNEARNSRNVVVIPNLRGIDTSTLMAINELIPLEHNVIPNLRGIDTNNLS